MDKTLKALIDQEPTAEDIRLQMRKQVRGYMALVAVVSLLAGGIIGHTLSQEAQPWGKQPLEPPENWESLYAPETAPDATPAPTPTAPCLHVYVSGAVAAPQVVTITGGSLVADALEAAGGPAPNADMDALNLAAPLYNYEHIIVPTQETAAALHETQGTGTLPESAALDLNTATAPELEALPGIGETKAAAIVAYRDAHGPFQTADALLAVDGIGPALLSDITPYLIITP